VPDVSLLQLDEPRRARIADDLSRLVEGEVRFGRHDRMLYATDASIYEVEPIGVVIPVHAGDVEAVVRFCADRGLPLLPRGGGTSLAGQCVNTAVMIDMAPHVNGVVSVDPRRRTAVVEPGLVLDRLNEALAPHDLMFGPDVATATHANLGGMIGNNSAGAHSVLYGRTVEHLLALDVLLADGRRVRLDEGAATRDSLAADLARQVAEVVWPLADEIDRRFPKTRRRVNGYNLDLVLGQLRASAAGSLDRVNLAALLCGSEGTLGVTVQADLSLVDRPRARGLTLLGFDDVMTALAQVEAILGLGPAAVELIDDMVIELALANTACRPHVELLRRGDGALPGAVLYVESFGASSEAVEEQFARVRDAFGDRVVLQTRDPGAMDAAWTLRRSGEPLLHGRPGPRKPITFIEDLAVDPASLPEFIGAFRALMERHGTRAACYAHASVGCLHLRPLIDLGNPADRDRMERIAEEATDLVMRFGGALSGEHGDGRLRSHLLERFYGERIVEGFRRIKAIFDPGGRLNPGIIVDPSPMRAHLRPAAPGPLPSTFFRYEREGGLAAAASQCNGAGVCRKTSGGVMCPSYRATRDERHATRGRGNALRLAVTGGFSPDGRSPAWNDLETRRTLELCLSCKACKSECPSNVDVARLKAEYTAQGYAAGPGPALSARVFASIRTINRWGSRGHRIANALAARPAARRIVGALLDIDPRRSLPPFEPSLHRWLRRRRPPRIARDAPAVILLPDCFCLYGETGIGRAAVLVLEALGYRVVVPRAGCCGRAAISLGLLPRAIATAAGTARRLERALDAHGAERIVGCEPSCVSAITDDWPDLALDVPRSTVDRLAAATGAIEDFVESGWMDHPRAVGDAMACAGDEPVLLHGHCHQKALWGTRRSEALLRRFVGDRLRVLDAGCCGMAGAFGYAREHYDLSMRIAALELLPALRSASDAVLVAPGTSCRHQVRDGAGRAAVHPIEIVAEGLGVGGAS
jgi:FAD/FMN-containing dehydrogenase/Fe-S oxidoreductase